MRTLLLLLIIMAGFGCELPSAPKIDNRYDPLYGKQAIPTAPTSLRIKVSSSNSITLTWEDRSSFETAYEIRRRNTQSNDYLTIGTVKNTEFTDNTVLPTNSYFYYVFALTSTTKSAMSNVILTTYQTSLEEWKYVAPPGSGR